MTKSGHRLTAFALAASGAQYLGLPEGFAWAAGCMMGASAPDYLEIVYGYRSNQRMSVIRHRTWTHQPLLWLAAMAALIFVYWQRTPYHLYALAWLAAGLLHLSMDILTPMGIPLGLPWGKRTSLALYRTGGSEWPIILIVWLAAASPYLWPKIHLWMRLTSLPP